MPTPDEALTPRQRAARANGRKSRGPVTPEGKARSARNALRHGLRSAHAVVLASEDAAAFTALGAALELDLAPVGAMEQVLVERIAAALWRLRRAERLETLFLERALAAADAPEADPLACLESPRLATLMRYQAHLQSELHRAHGALRRAQRERRAAEAREQRRDERCGAAAARPRDAFGRALPGEVANRTNEPKPAAESLAAAQALRRDPALAAHGDGEIAAIFQRILDRRTAAAGAPASGRPFLGPAAAPILERSGPAGEPL
jgi:hypothetical protein